MINISICIKNHQDRSAIGGTYSFVNGVLALNNENIAYNSISGLTSDGIIEHYTGQTNSEAYIAVIPILLTQIIDDIGYYDTIIEEWSPKTQYNVGNIVEYNKNSQKCIVAHFSDNEFNPEYWLITPTGSTTYDITLTGETKIEQFRRYGKTESDLDLYKPGWNMDFSQIINTANGISKQILAERINFENPNGQKLYDYKIWVSGDTGTTISYSDINRDESIISYTSTALSKNNSIEGNNIKSRDLIGIIAPPKINVDVFIDRGNNASFERHIRLGDIKSLNDMETYGDGYYKIKEN